MALRVLSVVGTRPNLTKMAPIVAELERRDGRFESLLVHTGQHYDRELSEIFFEQLALPEPDRMLGIGSGSHAAQTAQVLSLMEGVLEDLKPDVVLVPGDVNSSLGGALAAVKMNVPIGHVEAGLRSFDRSMPEEINRILIDSISDLLFTHSPEARDHLLAEGRSEKAIHAVGNTMIDSLQALRPNFDPDPVLEPLEIDRQGYILVTLHRPALVDGSLLGETINALNEIADTIPVIFPSHPRTRARMDAESLVPAGNLHLTQPLGYLEFMGLVESAAGVLTDSGGVQEETTILGVPCFTLRDNTERPVTLTDGTNVLLGLEPRRIREVPDLIRAAAKDSRSIPAGWDGQAATRLVDVLEDSLIA